MIDLLDARPEDVPAARRRELTHGRHVRELVLFIGNRANNISPSERSYIAWLLLTYLRHKDVPSGSRDWENANPHLMSIVDLDATANYAWRVMGSDVSPWKSADGLDRWVHNQSGDHDQWVDTIDHLGIRWWIPQQVVPDCPGYLDWIDSLWEMPKPDFNFSGRRLTTRG